jgi:hypothetical protein
MNHGLPPSSRPPFRTEYDSVLEGSRRRDAWIKVVFLLACLLGFSLVVWQLPVWVSWLRGVLRALL